MPSIVEQLEARMSARAEAGEEIITQPEPEDLEQEEAPEEDAQEGEQEVAEGAEEPEEIQSLLDFGKAAGWEPEDLYALKFRLDTGEELALGEIKDKLQTYAREHENVQEQTKRLNEYAEQLQAQAQQYFEQRQSEGAEAQAAREAMLQVEARYNSVDWDKLSQSDPGRAALLQQQLAVDYAGAKSAHQAAVAKEQQAAAQYAEQARMQHAQQLVKAIPEWKDNSRVQQEYPEIQKYLGQWFKPQELETIYDWRAINIARKAYLYDQGQNRMKETQEKVRAAPKPVLKPGTGALRGAAEQAHTAALVKKARESGNRNDKFAAAAAVLGRAMKQK